MRRISAAMLLLLLASALHAQVVLPQEVKDANARILQQKYLPQLKQIGSLVEEHQFPYAFYFSKVLDVDLEKAQRSDQRSIRFERYDGRMMLAITGNYYASYSAERMDRNARVKRTFEDIVLPLLKASVPLFANDDSFTAYAFEVSHHVRRKVMGLSTENAENAVFLLPRGAAQHLASATAPDEVQAALLESEVFVDTEPIQLWYSGSAPPLADSKRSKTEPRAKRADPPTEPATLQQTVATPEPTVSAKLMHAPEIPVRIITPKTLASLKSEYATSVSDLIGQLDGQAHFVSYAPPDFIGFHEAAYLQLSVKTTLDAPAGTSRYRVAALAFDEHISHLVRPVLARFQRSSDFDGVCFSTTVKQSGSETALAVEYFLPLHAMRCFARYDCTGQQLIDSSFLLINGERASLNLQVAEK
jgi:hypothetical protein